MPPKSKGCPKCNVKVNELNLNDKGEILDLLKESIMGKMN
jgi:hypothetical protein